MFQPTYEVTRIRGRSLGGSAAPHTLLIPSSGNGRKKAGVDR